MNNLTIFRKGDSVWWRDPDNDISSGLYKITRGHEYYYGDDIKISDLEGDEIIEISNGLSHAEVYTQELLKITDKKCPDCSNLIYDEYLYSTYKYYCGVCNKNLYGFEVD